MFLFRALVEPRSQHLAVMTSATLRGVRSAPWVQTSVSLCGHQLRRTRHMIADASRHRGVIRSERHQMQRKGGLQVAQFARRPFVRRVERRMCAASHVDPGIVTTPPIEPPAGAARDLSSLPEGEAMLQHPTLAEDPR